MSFKYRFILSFVLLEAFFITLIVTMNYVAINDSSKKLIEQKIKSNIEFLNQLVKIPITIYDLATLDNLVESSTDLGYINSLVILDAQDKVLSKKFKYKHNSLDEILLDKDDKSIKFGDISYEIRYKKLYEEELLLGSLFIIFDTTESTVFINKSLKNTAFIILIEIILSTILSYLIGSRLTKMLTDLSDTAKEIGEYKYPEVPYQDKSDEIGVLSKSMAQMLVDLKDRRTKLKNLALELNEQKNELIEANKAKDDFLANMSHELKTPLNSINVISSIMMRNKKQKLDEEQVKNLTIINRCGNDLLFLINDVLDISKLEAGEVILNFETISLEETITELSDMFEPQTKEKKLNFIVDVPKTVDFIYSDKNRIKQIVKNLLSNSLKFVENGSIRLIVKDLDDKFEIAVKDDGIGISAEKLEHIFDRFKQADGSTTRKYGGTGLGLAICKELAILLGGDISVKSKVDMGTTFTVLLPKNLDKVNQKMVSLPPKEVVKIETEPIVEEEKIDKSSKPKVLLLNNDPIAFISIAISLKSISEFEQVNSLVELLKKLKEKSYDKIIVDITKVDETEFKKVVNSLNFHFIVICNNEKDIDEEIKGRVSTIVEKPVDEESLINIVKG